MNANPDAGRDGAGPIIILSYLHSGAEFVQEVLANGTDLACTVGTAILPMCDAAALAWTHIDNRARSTLSPLAIHSIRALVSTQLNVILATNGPGKRRWCELAIASPSAAETFLQIVPSARFVCVHRACPAVVSAAIAAHPWGLANQALLRFAIRYPGNAVAAVAEYWLSAAERMLAFESRYAQFTTRVRYEDVIASEHALDAAKSALDLHDQPSLKIPKQSGLAGGGKQSQHVQVPISMIPDDLRKKIDGLHTELGFPEGLHGDA